MPEEMKVAGGIIMKWERRHRNVQPLTDSTGPANGLAKHIIKLALQHPRLLLRLLALFPSLDEGSKLRLQGKQIRLK